MLVGKGNLKSGMLKVLKNLEGLNISLFCNFKCPYKYLILNEKSL